MDFDFAGSQLVDLLLRPSEIAKTTSIRKQIKNQWARDDPALHLMIAGMTTAAALAFYVTFAQQYSIASFINYVILPIIVHFIGFGLLFATCLHWFLNRSMRVQRVYVIEQRIEWLYAIDVHYNAFFPAFCLLGPIQFLLLPLLIQQHFIMTFVGNTLYCCAALVYVYVSFLGYSALPFLERVERLLYPAAALIFTYLLAIMLNFNIAHFILQCYYGQAISGDADDPL